MADQRSAILLESAVAAWRWTHGYVEDVAEAIVRAVVDDRAAGQVYNVGEACTPTTADRVRSIGEIMGWSGTLVALSRDRLPQHLQAPYEPWQDLTTDTRRIRDALGLERELGSMEGLRRTIEWEISNPPPSGDPGLAEYMAEDAALR
jgi:nucleoside-diphosphate-sugar epimerase